MTVHGPCFLDNWGVIDRESPSEVHLATLGSGAPITRIWGQPPHRGKKLLAVVVSPILSHRSSLKTTNVNNFLTPWGR